MENHDGGSSPASSTYRSTARLAGLFYLVTILCGLFAEIAVRAHIRDADAAVTLHNLMQEQGWYRLGEAADLVMLCCYIAVTALLYRLFAPGSRSLALIAAGFSMIGIAVLAVAGVLHLMPLAVLERDMVTQADVIVQLALDMHGDLYGISLVFFGVYCVLIGILCIRSRLLPLPVGLMMLIGGLAHVVGKFLWIAAPAAHDLWPRSLNMLPLLGETVLAVWLLLFGVRKSSLS